MVAHLKVKRNTAHVWVVTTFDKRKQSKCKVFYQLGCAVDYIAEMQKDNVQSVALRKEKHWFSVTGAIGVCKSELLLFLKNSKGKYKKEYSADARSDLICTSIKAREVICW